MALRSTFAGLNTMYRGISTNRLSLETTGHNMTNSSVTGYSRQSVNQAAVLPDAVYASGTKQYVGSGVDSLSITRARDVYADKQYWRDYSDLQYFYARQKNYQKVEAIFNDSQNNGLQNAINSFYQSWVDFSKEASTDSERVAVLEKGRILAERIGTAGKQLQQQTQSEYEDIKINVEKVNTITSQIVELNKAIMAAEAVGGSANDLRDARDNLADELSGFMSVTVSENGDTSMYTIVSNGCSIVNGITKLDLTIGPKYDDGRMPGIPNTKYGITDYNIEIGDTGVVFDPLNGTLKAEIDAIAEDKAYIDMVADMAAFLLTTFNAEHKQGAGRDVIDPMNETQNFPATGLNFFGEQGTAYIWDDATKSIKVYGQTVETKYENSSWEIKVETDANVKNSLDGINIINALQVSTVFAETGGERKIAARAIDFGKDKDGKDNPVPDYTTPGKTDTYTVEDVNGTADGSVATHLSTLINLEDTKRTSCSIGVSSFVGYYNTAMTRLGVDAETMNSKVVSQEDVVEQVHQWRASVSGVNWDEELTNMIMFQQGYSACSRCLTTIDEMLDRLINSTGVVGR